MAKRNTATYEFANFRVIAADRELLCEGRRVKLPPKVFDALLLLVERGGALVDKDEFLKELWPDTFVEEATLAHCVSELRKTLRLENPDLKVVETVSKRGYRFLPAVSSTHADAEPLRGAKTVVAVLPFENLGPDTNREYLADGLTEEVIIALGQIEPERLSVIGRTTAMTYKNSKKSLQEIGKELGAALLLESSIRAEGERVRVTSTLVRAVDQVQIWSARYDSEPQSILSFQRELSTTIAEQIRLRLSPARLDALAKRQAHNPEAYDAYLRGRYYWNHFTPATTRRAIECYERATELDPAYALAWSGLADAYASSPIHADVCPGDVTEKARIAAGRAIEAEPELAEVQTSWGFVKYWLDWDWREAEAAYRRAIRLDPTYSLVYRLLGILLGHAGHREVEAREAMARARSLDPLQAMHHALSAQVLFLTRDYGAAFLHAKQAAVVQADFWIAALQAAQALEQEGAYEAALDALQRAGAPGGENSKVMSLRGYLLAKLGRRAEALSVAEKLQSLAHQRYVPPYAVALVYAGLDDREEAFAWLEKAVDGHDVHLVSLPCDPKWDGLRGDPRFAAILTRCGLPYPGGTRA